MSRIILTGPAAAGKDFIKTQFRNKGFICDVSYTSRPRREGEVDGIDYNFISENDFLEKIDDIEFYEWAQHGGFYYGTGLDEWRDCEVFIMEAHGVAKISPKDRVDCVVIFINTPEPIRYSRLLKRGWTPDVIDSRFLTDNNKFSNFTNYDFTISSE